MTPVALSILFGALIGLSPGLVGGGGSILTVPGLVYVIGPRPRRRDRARKEMATMTIGGSDERR